MKVGNELISNRSPYQKEENDTQIMKAGLTAIYFLPHVKLIISGDQKMP